MKGLRTLRDKNPSRGVTSLATRPGRRAFIRYKYVDSKLSRLVSLRLDSFHNQVKFTQAFLLPLHAFLMFIHPCLCGVEFQLTGFYAANCEEQQEERTKTIIKI